MDFNERMNALRPEADGFFEGACLGSGYKMLDEWALETAKVLWCGVRMLREEYGNERSEVIEEYHSDGHEGGDEERLLERDVQSP